MHDAAKSNECTEVPQRGIISQLQMTQIKDLFYRFKNFPPRGPFVRGFFFIKLIQVSHMRPSFPLQGTRVDRAAERTNLICVAKKKRKEKNTSKRHARITRGKHYFCRLPFRSLFRRPFLFQATYSCEIMGCGTQGVCRTVPHCRPPAPDVTPPCTKTVSAEREK